MNLGLSHEQELLREAARGALSRFDTLAVARAALDGAPLPDLWPTAQEAGWTTMLVDESRGGAGLSAFDAMLVLGECGRALAPIPLLGHLPATVILDAAGRDGDRRCAWLPARPPGDTIAGFTVAAERGQARVAAPVLAEDGTLTGTVAWVPDAPGAELLVVVAVRSDGTPAAVAIDAASDGVAVEPVTSYDATRALAHVTLSGASGELLEVTEADLVRTWYLAQAFLAAEAVGSVEIALERSVAYAKERYTFGRAIGSYQAVKHALVEVLRRLENARSLLYYAGWAYVSAHSEFALASSAARSVAGGALDYAARELISVHGGIGATWEHDAPLFFRRAQVSRRLLGGDADATDRVAGELLATAA